MVGLHLYFNCIRVDGERSLRERAEAESAQSGDDSSGVGCQK